MRALRSTAAKWAKPLLSRTVYRPGSVRKIRRGPAKGMRYRIYPGYGLAPLYGRMEPDVQLQLVNRLRPGAIAIDVGANYGIHTLLMAKLVGESGAVIAFEPSPDLFSELETNLQRNGLRNVTVMQMAVSDSAGDAEFYLGDSSATGRLRSLESTPAEDRGPTIKVTATSLDLLASKGDIPLPDLIKIDVEGAESRVLEGGVPNAEHGRPGPHYRVAQSRAGCGSGRHSEPAGVQDLSLARDDSGHRSVQRMART